MGLHKLTAGDGYTYLTRQVVVPDATDRRHTGLGDYYAEKGESPGPWWGADIGALDLDEGSVVTETHMKNLYGAAIRTAQAFEDATLGRGGPRSGKPRRLAASAACSPSTRVQRVPGSRPTGSPN